MNERKLTVLVVDGSPFVVEILARVVPSFGHFVVKTKDGEMVLEFPGTV
jgi:CheY-like chemotaxis protein